MTAPKLQPDLVGLRNVIDKEVKRFSYNFDPKHPRIPLSIPTFGADEILDALDSMVSTRVTMGEKVFEFERRFASYIGTREAVMVNSGSSANLIAFSVLANGSVSQPLRHGFEAVVPAVTWSTTIFPIHQVGGIPVLTDVQKRTFNLDAESANKSISKRTGVLVPVHLLGNPVEMRALLKIASENRLRIVEDGCEAHGAEVGGRKVGGIGDIGTFSFFFSHHITTMEGGIVVSNDVEYAEVSRELRAHGWVRELKSKERQAKMHPAIDPRFLFVNTGYNLRPTEIQGAFGLHQLRKLERFIDIRRKNASFLIRELSRYDRFLELQEERSGTRHVWFGFPITIRDDSPFSMHDLTSFLEQRGIETRPIMAGNMAEQPALKLFRNRLSGTLRNSRRIMRRSFFFGNHHGLDDSARHHIVSSFEAFMKSKNLTSSI